MAGSKSNRLYVKMEKRVMTWLILLICTLFTVTGCGTSESNGDSTGSTSAYEISALPQKFMSEIPESLKAGESSTTSSTKSRSNVTAVASVKSRTVAAKSTSTENTESTENSTATNQANESFSDCDPRGSRILKKKISEMELFKAETKFKFIIIDNFYDKASEYVSKNGNPIPAGKLEATFTKEMKVALLNQFTENLHGKKFQTMIASALEASVGKTIKNPEMTLIEDPEDSDNDGYHHKITFGEFAGPDIEEIITAAWENIYEKNDKFYGMSKTRDWGDSEYGEWDDSEYGEWDDSEDGEWGDSEDGEWGDSKDGEWGDSEDGEWGDSEDGEWGDSEDGEWADSEDGDWDDSEYGEWDDDEYDFENDSITESTVLKWSKDKTKVSISKKESSQESGAYELMEICNYDASTGKTTFAENYRDESEESKMTHIMEEKDGGKSVKIKTTDYFKSLKDNSEETWEIETSVGETGGYMIETFIYTDSQSKTITESFKETFDKDGNVTGVFFKEEGNDKWEKGDCDSFDDEECDEYCDFDEWDDEFINETICVAVKNVTESGIGIVFVPENVPGPGEEGFEESEFFSQVIGFGHTNEGKAFASFWGDEDDLNAGVKVYKETFENNNTVSATITLLENAIVEKTECENYFEEEDDDEMDM